MKLNFTWFSVLVRKWFLALYIQFSLNLWLFLIVLDSSKWFHILLFQMLPHCIYHRLETGNKVLIYTYEQYRLMKYLVYVHVCEYREKWGIMRDGERLYFSGFIFHYLLWHFYYANPQKPILLNPNSNLTILCMFSFSSLKSLRWYLTW